MNSRGNKLNNQNIVIYGAGKYARVLYRRYKIAGRSNEIAYFLVTNNCDNLNKIDEIPVYTYDEKKNDLHDKKIIIAMSRNNSENIIDLVKKYNPLNISCMSVMEYKYSDFDYIEICKRLPIERNKVVFYCFEGRGYMCNCKYLAEYLRIQGIYDIYWIVRENLDEKDLEIPSNIKILKRYTLEFYKELYTAGFIITNFNNPGIEKRSEQYYINTWHGIGPFKCAGADASFNDAKVDFLKNYALGHGKSDLKIAASDDCIQMYRRSMLYKGDILKCGYPRNDIFFGANNIRVTVREKFKIKNDQLLVLYAPTFRDNYDNFRESFSYYDIDLDMMIDALKKRFGKDIVLMYRFHQYLQDFDECINFYSNGINVTSYLDTQELLCAADVLITDYSSIMWDFSLTKKPVFLYQKDVIEYSAYRGFYSEPETWPYPQAHDSNEMCMIIDTFDENKYLEDLESFFKKYGSYDDGHAAERIEERMRDVLQHPEKYGKETSHIECHHDYFYKKCITPRISVIVPVYNSGIYLRQCLDSILSQTLKDIEIICIDDGSTDISGEILDEYAKKDDRLIVIHKENRGYGNSINAGMEVARGSYVGIVESDDFIARNMYERLYKAAVDNDLDMVKCECYFCWDSINYRIPRHVAKMDGYYNKVLTGEERGLFFGFFMNTWSGIYKKDFLKYYNICHHETPGASFQDNGFWMQTMYHARRAMWIPEQLYYYRQDNENSSVRSDNKVFEMNNEYTWIERKLREQYVSEDDMRYCYYYRLFRNKGNLLRISDERKYDFSSVVVEDYNKYNKALALYLNEKNYGWYKKICMNGEWLSKELLSHMEIERWYKELLEDPIGYIESIIKKKNEILSIIDDSKKIYIIGTSWLAQRILRILYRNNLHQRITAFISVESVQNSHIAGIPVKGFYDPDVRLNEGLVMVGAARNTDEYSNYTQMLDRVEAKIHLDCEDLTNVFYWIY